MDQLKSKIQEELESSKDAKFIIIDPEDNILTVVTNESEAENYIYNLNANVPVSKIYRLFKFVSVMQKFSKVDIKK